LLSGTAIFLLFQATLNVAVRAEWVPLRDPVYFEKLALLRGHPAFFAPAADPVCVLALGSSRTQLAVDAATLSADLTAAAGRPVVAFNFGTPAGGPMTSNLYLRRLFAAGVRPAAVLVEVHPCFVAAGGPFEARWLHAYRLRADEIDTLRGFGYPVGRPPHLGWQGYLTAAYAYRFPALDAVAPRWLPCPFGLTAGVATDRHGWVGGLDGVTPHDRRKLLAAAYAQYFPVFAGYRVGGAGAEAVRDTLALCRDHGVRAAVLVSAESGEFRGWYGPAGQAAVTAFAAGLGREFGVPVFDARDWVPDGGFADGHHMTPEGAAAFTARLAKETGPWVRGVGGAK
jgi:hypothetical protein